MSTLRNLRRLKNKSWVRRLLYALLFRQQYSDMKTMRNKKKVANSKHQERNIKREHQERNIIRESKDKLNRWSL